MPLHPLTESGPCWVYVLRAPRRVVLYVGVTSNPRRRMREHRASKPWWHKVAQVGWMEFPTRAAALAAESYLIGWLRPPYNVAHEAWRATSPDLVAPLSDYIVPVREAA